MEDANNKIKLRKRAILALSKAKGVGYYTIRKLYSVHKDLENLSEYSLDDLISLFKRARIAYSDRLAYSFFDNKKELFAKADVICNEFFNKRKITFILEDEPGFPNSLKEIPDRPFWLFAEGNLSVLHSQKNIAVIGTRHPTIKGIGITERLTRLLVQNNYIIVSGLAEGIDEVAHKITNQFKGKGIAVMGCGINLGFPSRTFKIRQELVSNGGVVISEYMIDDFYTKQKFVWRDRLQSGLSKVVLPIQGTMKSGTVHTVRFAEQQKRKIIGVFLDKIENIPQNELLSYLSKNNYPLFDLSNDFNKILQEIEKPYEYKKPIEEKDLFTNKLLEKEDKVKEKISYLQKIIKFILRK